MDEKGDGTTVSAIRSAKFLENVSTSVKESLQEMHQNRIKNLRKTLEYFKETEWKYEPIEKYIGQ